MNNDYNRSPQEVLEELGSCPTGLTEQQAAERCRIPKRTRW